MRTNRSNRPYHVRCNFFPRLGSAGDRIFRGVDKDGSELLLIPNRHRRGDGDPEIVMLAAPPAVTPLSGKAQGWGFPWDRPLKQQPRSDGTGLEAAVRNILGGLGLSYREQVASLPGTPDFLLVDYHVVVCAHGCRWHGHGCHRGAMARDEFRSNIERDAVNEAELIQLGFRIYRIWECALIGIDRLSFDQIGLALIDFVEGRETACSIPDLRSP
jgi:DNA mismatch endonuclease (patch repair protein)